MSDVADVRNEKEHSYTVVIYCTPQRNWDVSRDYDLKRCKEFCLQHGLTIKSENLVGDFGNPLFELHFAAQDCLYQPSTLVFVDRQLTSTVHEVCEECDISEIDGSPICALHVSENQFSSCFDNDPAFGFGSNQRQRDVTTAYVQFLSSLFAALKTCEMAQIKSRMDASLRSRKDRGLGTGGPASKVTSTLE